MLQPSPRLAIWTLIIAVLAVLVSWPVLAAPAGQELTCVAEYTMQADDGLSQIADKFLGDRLAYPAIVSATNRKHSTDPSFQVISEPDVVAAGQKVCIPGGQEARVLLAEASPATRSATLVVFAAASLTESFTDMGRVFEAEHPGVHIVFNFAGSQQLAQQLGQGAPADIFASANDKQMDAAIATGRIAQHAAQTFAHNRLVVIYPLDNPARITRLQDLARSGLHLVLAAREVPVGQYSLDFLDKAGRAGAFGPPFEEDVLKNVVSYEENVKSVLAKVALGEGDAGIVYTSDISGDSAARVGRLDIPDAFNTIASYPIASVTDSARPELARTFINWVLSPPGQAALARYGLLPARPAG